MTEEKVRTTIYWKKSIHQPFKDICEREGKTVSEKLEKFALYYNNAHSPGNPQNLIVSYLELEDQPQPMRVLCNFLDGALTDGRVHCRRAMMWIPGIRCYSCPKNELRNK